MIGWKRNRCSQQRLLDKKRFLLFGFTSFQPLKVFFFVSLPAPAFATSTRIYRSPPPPAPLPLPAHALQNPILISISPDNSIEPFL